VASFCCPIRLEALRVTETTSAIPKLRLVSDGFMSALYRANHQLLQPGAYAQNPSMSVMAIFRQRSSFCYFMAPYFLRISLVFSIGSACTVCPCAVMVSARNIEL